MERKRNPMGVAPKEREKKRRENEGTPGERTNAFKRGLCIMIHSSILSDILTNVLRRVPLAFMASSEWRSAP